MMRPKPSKAKTAKPKPAPKAPAKKTATKKVAAKKTSATKPAPVKPAPVKPAKPPFVLDVQINAPAWRKRIPGVERLCANAAKAALLASGRKIPTGGWIATLLLATDAMVEELNHQFRGRKKPTNVLSFPSRSKTEGTRIYIGDIVIAYNVTATEARTERKHLADHLAHLTAHGLLHLLGFDHEEAQQAERMEKIEIKALKKLGISNPYLGEDVL